MAIYNLFKEEKAEQFTETFEERLSSSSQKKSSLFSSLLTRGCFFLLLLADLLWLVYVALAFSLSGLGALVTLGRAPFFQKGLVKGWLNFRRAIVCAISLLLGLFCPPFGIMVACTFFLMYDKAGMEEVVPAPLQAQFKDLFRNDLQ